MIMSRYVTVPLPFGPYVTDQRYATLHQRDINVTDRYRPFTDRYRILPLLALQALPILKGPFEQIFKVL